MEAPVFLEEKMIEMGLDHIIELNYFDITRILTEYANLQAIEELQSLPITDEIVGRIAQIQQDMAQRSVCVKPLMAMCTYPGFRSRSLTKGSHYNILEQTAKRYLVIDDRGTPRSYGKHRFTEPEQKE